MSSGNKVTLTFAGDEGQLSKSFADVGKQAEGLDSKIGGVSDTFTRAGRSSKTVADSADEAAGHTRKLGEAFDETGEKIDPYEQRFQGVADISGGVVQGFQAMTTGGLSLSDRLQALGGAGADLAGGFAVLVPALGGLVSGFGPAIGAVKAFSLTLLTSPITWIVAGIALIIAAIVLMVTHWQTVKQVAGTVFAFLRSAFQPVVSFFQSAWHTVQTAFSTAFNWVKSNWPLILAILTGPIGIAVGLIVSNWAKIKAGASTVINWLKTAWGGVTGAVRAVGTGIMNAFKSAFDFVAEGWNSTIGSISFSIPSWVPGIGGAGFSVPKIPLFDSGGTVGGPGGSHSLAMLQAGETVLPTQGGSMRIADVSGGASSGLDALFLDWLREKVRKGQLVLVPS